MKFNFVTTFFLLALALFTGCQCSNSSGKGSASMPSDLVTRGKSVYQANCISCHNSNPKLAGSLGPDVAGSSKELLEARIIKGNYPDGYKPKRSSRIMQALPHLSQDIDAMAAYLNQN